MRAHFGTAKHIACMGAVIAMVFSLDSGAQLAPRQPQPAVDELEPVLILQGITGVGPRTRVPTPQYRTSVPQGRATAGQWAQITVTYDSMPEWIDSISFQYYALLVREVRGEPPAYQMFRGTVTYMDIARGRGKESTVFLRPNTLARYGQVIGVAVEIIHEGQTIASLSQEQPRSVADGRPEWWRSPNLPAQDGYILNRSQTPFAFINFDEYEIIQP